MDELAGLTEINHHQAELERLKAGYDGCGCLDCQKLYKTLDLYVFGDRVIKIENVICVVAGRQGSEKWKQYHQEPNGETVLKPSKTSGSGRNNGAKVQTRELHHPELSACTFAPHKKTFGRPRKTGQVSRWAELRRRQRDEKQLSLAEV
jgi:hypothetical protein